MESPEISFGAPLRRRDAGMDGGSWWVVGLKDKKKKKTGKLRDGGGGCGGRGKGWPSWNQKAKTQGTYERQACEGDLEGERGWNLVCYPDANRVSPEAESHSDTHIGSSCEVRLT